MKNMNVYIKRNKQFVLLFSLSLEQLIDPQSAVESAVDKNYEELATAFVHINFNAMYL
jgi:hypothetical protein